MSAFFTSSPTATEALVSEAAAAGQGSPKPTSWWNRFWDECFDFKLEFSVLESRSRFCPAKQLARAKLKLVAFNPHHASGKSLAHLTIVK